MDGKGQEYVELEIACRRANRGPRPRLRLTCEIGIAQRQQLDGREYRCSACPEWIDVSFILFERK